MNNNGACLLKTWAVHAYKQGVIKVAPGDNTQK